MTTMIINYIVEMLRHLGSLLSNVNSADQNLPIIPLHSHSVISSQIKRRAVIFMSAFKMLTVNWPIPVSVYCSKISHSTSVISKHHILLTKTLNTLTPASINTSHLHCCMPVVSGNILTSKLICLEDFELSLRRNFIFWLEALSLISDVGLASAACSSLNMC